MSRAMPITTSAPLVEDQELMGHHGPPPTYEQAVGQGGFKPPVVQPAIAPYPQQNYMDPGMVLPPPIQQQPAAVPPPPTTESVTGALPLGPEPVKMRCPHCHTDIRTTHSCFRECNCPNCVLYLQRRRMKRLTHWMLAVLLLVLLATGTVEVTIQSESQDNCRCANESSYIWTVLGKIIFSKIATLGYTKS